MDDDIGTPAPLVGDWDEALTELLLASETMQLRACEVRIYEDDGALSST